jgi:hypothetical protein
MSITDTKGLSSISYGSTEMLDGYDDIEEILYCEWPALLMEMVKALHAEGELECTDIQNKFG